jgi:hypothetical protein
LLSRARRAGESTPPLDDAIKGSPGKGKAKRAGEAALATGLPSAKKAKHVKDAKGHGRGRGRAAQAGQEGALDAGERGHVPRPGARCGGQGKVHGKQLAKEKRRRDREAVLNELSVISFKNIYSWMVKSKGWLCVPGQRMVSWMYIRPKSRARRPS